MKTSKLDRQTGEDHLRSPAREEFQKELARLVIRQRMRRGWSQEQLAKRAKLSVRTIQAVESKQGGRLRIPGGLRLCRLLGLRLRFDLVESPVPPENSLRLRRVLKRGEKYLAALVRRLPPPKRRALMCTTNEIEFLLEAAMLVAQEGW